MKKTLIASAVIVVIVVAGIYYANVSSLREQEDFDAENSAFTIDGELVTLIDGKSEIPAAPDSESKIITRYVGMKTTGDLNDDNLRDVAFLVTQDSGASGFFYYAVVALRNADGYTTTNAVFIGDRITPQSMKIDTDSMELQVNYADRGPGEPMTAQPSVESVKLLRVSSAGILEEVIANTEIDISWRFANTDEIEGIPYTAVTVHINDISYNVGEFEGSCSEIGATGGIDGTGLLVGELSAVQCWFAGGGNEIGVFAHEDGGVDVMVGELGEGEEGAGVFRGNFKIRESFPF